MIKVKFDQIILDLIFNCILAQKEIFIVKNGAGAGI